MIAGASSTPGLAAEVAARIAPWRTFTTEALRGVLEASPLSTVVEPDVAAHAVVALYLGLEMLAHLDGDRSSALALFDRARLLAGLVQMFGAPSARRGTAAPGGGMTQAGHRGASRRGRPTFPADGFDVVTGAFSYSGAAIARELERTGRRVRTLTGHPERAHRRRRH